MGKLSNEDALKNIQQTNLEDGLNAEEVKKRLVEYGYNEVPEKCTSFWVALGKRFWGIVPWMLEVTIVLTLLLGKPLEAFIIVVLLIFNAGMSQWREGRAKEAIATLKQRLRIESRVKRNGEWLTIPARELVPSDLVRVRTGDLLPADIVIVEGSIGVDQSILTGESGILDRSCGEIAY